MKAQSKGPQAESGKRIHLVLGAGGIRSLAYAGALKALEEAGYSFASVSASSAGGLVGALLCAGLSPNQIEESVRGLSAQALAGGRNWPWRRITPPFAQYRSSGVPAFIQRLLRETPGIKNKNPKLGELAISFSTLALDLISHRILAYSSETHPEMLLSEVLDIAVSVPFMYPAHERENRFIVDGAIASRCPAWLAISPQRDNSLPILALRSPEPLGLEKPSTLPGYIKAIISAAVSGRDEYLLQQSPRVSIIEIDVSIASDDFRLSSAQIQGLVDRGYHETVKALQKSLVGNKGLQQQAAQAEDNSDDSRAVNSASSLIQVFIQEAIMGDKIKTGDGSFFAKDTTLTNVNLNINSMLEHVSQSINAAEALSKEKKGELQAKVDEFKDSLRKLEKEHQDETALIAQRLDEFMTRATKPPAEQKPSLLSVSAKGLTDAAETLKSVMPTLVTLAAQIVAFFPGAR